MASQNPLVDLLKMETINTPAESPQPIKGQGGGLADFVPASIEGQEPALLSEGEFVWPADVVSFVGNGSSDAGARVLNNIVSEVRKMMKQSGSEQSPPLHKMLNKVK